MPPVNDLLDIYLFYVCIYVCLHNYTICMQSYMYVHTFMYVYIYTYACMYVRSYVCLYVCMYVWYSHIYNVRTYTVGAKKKLT